MARGKRSDKIKKKELSHWSFIVGVIIFLYSLIVGKFNLEKLVSQNNLKKCGHSSRWHKADLEKNKKKFKLEAEHVFVFLLVVFFLGFMFLDYSLGLQEFFQTQTLDWTGEFWQTQSDGENITLGNFSDWDNNYTKLLIHADGTNASTAFADDSGKGNSLTGQGNARLETGVKQFGTASLYLNDYDNVTIPDSNDWNFSSDNFTIDFWINMFRGGQALPYGIIHQVDDSNNYWTIYYANDALVFFVENAMGGGEKYKYIYCYHGAGQACNIPVDTWTHVAVVVNGTNSTDMLMFINVGLAEIGKNESDSATSIPSPDLSGPVVIGTGYYNAQTYQSTFGYIDELRISKGIARWTENFTVPNAGYYYTQEGNYTSNILDAGTNARWE